MPSHKNSHSGFSLVELVVVLTLAVIASTLLIFVFKDSIFGYLRLQKSATVSAQLDSQSARIGRIIRGLSAITDATDNSLTCYAYFYPSDAYASKVRYYVDTNNGVKRLKAELTPMTANPPMGTPIEDQKKDFTLIDNYYQPEGRRLFIYLNGSNTELTTPVADYNAVKAIRINLASRPSDVAEQSINLQVTLRNRKTNL